MNYLRKGCMLLMAGILAASGTFGTIQARAAEDPQIDGIEVSGKSTSGHEASLAVDGNVETYYLTPSSSSMEDYYRYIDLKLDGLYHITKIEIFNQTNDTYNHYEIYASETGAEFNKIAYKDDDTLADADGETYAVDVNASQLRINLSYNSAQMEGNLAEVKVYGTRIGDAQTYETNIETTDFSETQWAEEYERFENDEEYANQKTINEMSELVGRVIGDEWKDDFVFALREDNSDGKDIFEVSDGEDGKILIRGNNGVAMASGFNYYLRYYCKVDYNPLFASQLDMPETLPEVGETIVKETDYDVRYALNFCTYSYTMAFWDWDEYEAFLDWAAMSGINLMLDIVGQEEVIRRTLQDYGYTDAEIKEYLCGPAYFAWYYMQNMTGYGGELPDSWFENRVELARKMHDRMQTYGITPVLSGFSGMVPTNFDEKYTDATVIEQGTWCGYTRPDMLRTYVDDGQKDYFSEMADRFYQNQRDIFGDVTNYYAVDPFHEGGRTGDMDVSLVYETVQQKMIENDEDAIWLIQQWSGSMTDAKLSGLKVKDQALVLDLFSEINPSYSVMERNDIPWVWCMLHNFGGRMGIDGNPDDVSQNIPDDYQSTEYMQGIGMTPEAIENSPMMYELLWDMTWTKDPIDYREWVQDYAERIYGGTNEDIQRVWEIMLETGYNSKDTYYQGAAESVINSRPTTNFTSASSWGHSDINYDKELLEEAAALMAKNYDTFKDSPAFVYDFVDILRQVVANSAQEYHTEMVSAYQNGDLELFDAISSDFLEMILLQDEILSCSSDFLVGTWIEDARSMVADSDDWTKDLFEFNARSLITTWGGYKNANGGGLRDYSNRQWAGLTKDYYYPRWEKWVNDAKAALTDGTAMPSTNWFLMEFDWANEKSDQGTAYATEASGGDLKALSQQVLDNYTIADLEELVETPSVQSENLALGKSVNASIATAEGSSTDLLTDGGKETLWQAAEHADSFTLSIDLEEEAQISGMEIDMQQIAGGFPYSYVVEAYSDGAWQIVAEDDSGEITSQTLIDWQGTASAVRFTFTSDDASIVPAVAELIVYGVQQEQKNYENVALGASVTTPTGETSLITDGDTGSLWVSNGDNYPAQIVLELDEEQYVDIMELYFEKPGLRYQYDVIIEDAQGNQTTVQDMSDNTQDLAGMYTIEIGANVKKVYVNLKARAEGGEFYLAWPALAEIELLQEQAVRFMGADVASGKTSQVINANGTVDTDILTNGSTSDLYNVGSDVFPTTFQTDFGREESIEQVVVHFEKAGLRFQYRVILEAEDGTQTVIQDMSENTADLFQSYTITLDEAIKARKVLVEISGRAAGGEFYLASPALSEIEAFATAENVAADAQITTDPQLSDEDLQKLLDQDSATSITLAEDGTQVFEFQLPQEIDLYAYEIIKKSDAPLRFQIETKLGDGEWQMFVDRSANTSDADRYVETLDAVLCDSIRLTVNAAGDELQDIAFYSSNQSAELLSYISDLRSKVNATTVGEYAGNYGQAQYDALQAAITAAEELAAGEMTSTAVSAQKEVLSEAYRNYLLSYVSIDRGALLRELNEAEILMSHADNEALNAAYDSARTVYETYKVTQAQLDEAQQALAEANDAALALLEGKEALQAQIELTQQLLDSHAVGSDTGNVSQETHAALAAAITKAQDALNSADAAVLSQAADELKQAADAFESQIITTDKSELNELIAKAQLLQEEGHTTSSWASFETALTQAETILAQSNSQEEVDKAVTDLQAAMDALQSKASSAALAALQTMVDKANALQDSTLNDEIAAVQALLDDQDNASTTAVVTALLNLSEAMQALNTDESIDALKADVQATIDFINENILTNLDNVRPGKVDALEAAVEAAQTLVDDPDASADELKAANKAMTKAAQELWEIVSKAELNALIEAANGYLDGNYTAESLEALQTAIEAAQAAANNDDATTAEVTEAIISLANAIAGLESVTLDTSALEHEIELVTEMIANLDDYVPSTVEGLQDKLADAQAAMNATTQEEIDAATETLREARLNARTKADVSALEELIAYVNSLELSAYTSASAQPVIQDLARANRMLANEEVTQEEVDNMVDALQASVDNLVEIGAESTNAGTPNADTTNTAAAAQTGMLAGLLALAGGALVVARRRKQMR